MPRWSRNSSCPTMLNLLRSSRPDTVRPDLSWATAADIARAVGSGETTAAVVIDDTLARIARLNPILNAFTAVTAERARKRAKTIDAARAAKQKPGPLAGVPFAVKNLFDIAGIA